MIDVKEKNLDELNIYDVGNTIMLTGAIYSDKNNHYLCFLPEEYEDIEFTILDMDLDEWKKFIRQTDIMETEILTKLKDGNIAKAILRKSARQIDQNISWRVYRRDNYTCRYCGITGIPLTVDHLVLWEEGGPTIDENLLTSCKKCNKIRGNTPYEEWIHSDEYKKRAKNLSDAIKEHNLSIVDRLDSIPRVANIKSR